MATSCEAFLSVLGPDVLQEMVDALVRRLSASPDADRYGYACNINDYVTIVCKAHPKDDIRRARWIGWSTPAQRGASRLIPMCAA